jgi:uncharacterized phage protein gp47/JayE
MTVTTGTQPQAYDRLQFLLAQGGTPEWNGIDYVEIASADQTQLRVHFLTTVAVAPATAPPLIVTITGGETIPTVPVLPIGPSAWSADADGRPLLSLEVGTPGDFSSYTLTIAGATNLDPYFDQVPFSFKANCPSDYDCGPTQTTCPEPGEEPVAIDYLAKDFAGFTQALSDFSALRYPNWVERSEADIGVMLMEALSAIADELSYYQERVAAEATIATATQRVSLVRHARLVDYEPAAAAAATTVVQLEVGSTTPVPAGMICSAPGANGTQIPFQVGTGLTGAGPAASYPVNPAWNALAGDGTPNLLPYWWDDSRQCLPTGSTSLWLVGHGHQLNAGQQLLIDTAGPSSGDPPVRELVTIAGVPVELTDPVFNRQLTRIDLSTATTLVHDLSQTHLAGNLVPVVQGSRTIETFRIPVAPAAGGQGPGSGEASPSSGQLAPAVVRTGANWTPEDPLPNYLYTLGAPQISWLPVDPQDNDTSASVALSPQITLSSTSPGGASPAASGGAGTQVWEWQRSLLGSAPDDTVFTLTPERYSRVGGSGGTSWFDYDGEGTTIRFGDGTFGLLPAPGTVFTLTYLSGGGTVGNVPADTIVTFRADPLQNTGPLPAISACTNPFPATGGADEETAQQIRDRAPQAFAAQPLRVVQPTDYVAAAQSEPWIQQAGTTFRWTGSWMTVFTAANPKASEAPTVAEVEGLSDLLNRRRLAGYESYVLPPRYVSVDLQITVVAAPSSFASDVAAAVLTQLQPGPLPGGNVGFFDHSRWRFGGGLDPSALLAAIQAAAGVVGVVAVQYRERGVQPSWAPLAERIPVPVDRLLRVDNDPSRPEAGSLSVFVEGGK